MSQWLDYIPEQDDFVFWGMHPNGVNHQVSKWPRPGSPRVDARFRMEHGDDCNASASRFLVRLTYDLIQDPPVGVSKDVWALMDLLPIEGGHIEGTTDPNPDGIVLRMSAESMDILPDQQVPGVLLEIELSLDDFGSVIYWEEYRNDGGNTNWTQNAENWVSGGNANGWIAHDDWVFGEYEQKLQAGSECYPFERQSGGDPGFAEFNGIDSYISLTDPVPAWSLPFRLTCYFRYQGIPDWMPIFGNIGMGGFFGMDDEDVVWGFFRRDTSWSANVGEWHKYRFDFEQIGQLSWQLYIDDINVSDFILGRQFSNANALGVYRQGVTGTIWGHFDLRDVLLLGGVAPNHTVRLDMPLRDNALDLGPEENHGTTHNMDLPSV